jgi:hypothetical protein
MINVSIALASHLRQVYNKSFRTVIVWLTVAPGTDGVGSDVRVYLVLLRSIASEANVRGTRWIILLFILKEEHDV